MSDLRNAELDGRPTDPQLARVYPPEAYEQPPALPEHLIPDGPRRVGNDDVVIGPDDQTWMHPAVPPSARTFGPQEAARYQPTFREVVVGGVKKVVMVTAAGALLLGAMGLGYILHNGADVASQQNGQPTGLVPTKAATHGPIGQPTKQPTKQPTEQPTQQPTQPPAPKPDPTATPNTPTRSAEWGETVNAQTYGTQGNQEGTLAGDQTNMYGCQTADGQYDKLQSPPSGAGPYVKAGDVQLLNGPNSLPICGTADTSSTQADSMLRVSASGNVLLVWRRNA